MIASRVAALDAVSHRFFEALEDVERCGFLEQLRHHDGRLFVAQPRLRWVDVACELSKRLSGQVQQRGRGLVWVRGSSSQWLCEACEVAKIERARAVALPLLAALDAPRAAGLGWSVGSCARALLVSIGKAQSFSAQTEAALDASKLNYHDCAPACYSEAALLDLQAAYFSMMQRAPSLRVIVDDERLLWLPLSDAENDRRALVFAGVEQEKTLRNALWGAALGGQGDGCFWQAGERRALPNTPGPFRSLARLVGRSCWELCRAASEQTQSVYSNVDCVVVAGDDEPRVWADAGLAWSTKAQGAADIRAAGVYRVGDYVTKRFPRAGAPESEFGVWTDAVARAPRPAREWWRAWLA